MADALKLPFAGEDLLRTLSAGADEPNWLLNDRVFASQTYTELPVESNKLFTLYVDLRGAHWRDIEPYAETGEATAGE